jgi:hypothetical protein
MKVTHGMKHCGGGESTWEETEIADTMLVGSKLRWAYKNGRQDYQEGAYIKAFQSNQTPCKVILKTKDGKEEINSATFAKEEDNQVFVSGNGFAKRKIGHIIRVRNLQV